MQSVSKSLLLLMPFWSKSLVLISSSLVKVVTTATVHIKVVAVDAVHVEVIDTACDIICVKVVNAILSCQNIGVDVHYATGRPSGERVVDK